MTPETTQGVLFTHRNHHLFSDYYLDHRAPLLPAWRQDDPRAAFDALRSLWQAVSPWIANANEAATEEGWIRPVLRELGHVYAVQVALQTPGGSKTPDYVICPDEAVRQKVQSLGRPAVEADLQGALAVADAKAWDRPLDRARNSKSELPALSVRCGYDVA